jgi:predicted O-methyltransferase YrrM
MQRNSHPAIPYIEALYAPEDALLKEISQCLVERNTAWQVGAVEGRLLQVLIAMAGVKTIVEIGTLAGYSTIWMARALPEDGRIITLDRDPKHCELARGFFARSDVGHKITLLEGDAHKNLATLTGEYDMVFIDADKPSYNAYLDWAEIHVRKGGLVVADNTLLFGSVYQDAPPADTAPTTWKQMRAFNERLADRSRYTGLLFPTEEGLSVAYKIL